MLEKYILAIIEGWSPPLLAMAVLVGVVVLISGGELMVRGASSIAVRLGIPPLIVGMTVVSFGTSAPELAVNCFAVLGSDPGISFGNIIGSNIANIGLVAACTALIRPVSIQKITVTRELPMMLLATLAVVVAASDQWLRQATGEFDRADGCLLLLFFAVFLYYTVGDVLSGRETSPLVPDDGPSPAPRPGAGVLKDAAVAISGLVLLVAGADGTVTSAELLATNLGVPAEIVGLTIVAIGTSLPELVTSVVASLRGNPDLAIGNIVGSNIFNLLFILGITSSVGAVPVPALGHVDLFVLLGFSLLMLTFMCTASRTVLRGEGAALMVGYFAYMAWRTL